MRIGRTLRVCRRELVELLRDRRALFVALATVLGLPPALAIAGQLVFAVAARTYVERRKADAAAAAVASSTPASKPRAIKNTVWVQDLDELPSACIAALTTETLVVLPVPPGGDGPAAVRQGRIQAYVRPPPSPRVALEDIAHTATFSLAFDRRSTRSNQTRSTIWSALFRWREELVTERLRAHGLDRASLRPLAIEELDQAPVSSSALVAARDPALDVLSDALGVDHATTLEQGVARARQFEGAFASLILCAIALLACVPSAVALGVVARDRGTLEALLLSPAARSEIALGKTLAIAASSLGLTLGAVLSGALTIAPVAVQARLLSDDEALRTFYRVFELDAGAVVASLGALVPFVVLASATVLALSTRARSEQEAGYTFLPVVLLEILLVALGSFPLRELPWSSADENLLALLPFTGPAVLVRELVAGEADGLLASNALLSTTLYALFALPSVVRAYEREEAVVRSAATGGFGFFDRVNLRDEAGRIVPTPAQALFLGTSVVLLEWVVGGSATALGIAQGLVATGALVLLAFPVAYAVGLGVDLAPTFGLAPARPRALAAGVLLGVATPVLALDVFALQARVTGELRPEEVLAYERVFRELTSGSSLGALVLVAALPGLLEELVFRGFVLHGLARRGPWVAVGASAALFALAHLDPARLGVTGLLGLLLGALALRTGSILPCIAAHVCHNAVAALSGFVLPLHEARPWLARGLAVGAVAAAFLLSGRRSRSP